MVLAAALATARVPEALLLCIDAMLYVALATWIALNRGDDVFGGLVCFLAVCVVDRVVARWLFWGGYRSRWAARDLYCPSRLRRMAAHDAGWRQNPGANVRRKNPRKNGTKQRGRSARGRACKPAALPHLLPTTAAPACAMAPPATPSGIVWHAECVVPL